MLQKFEIIGLFGDRNVRLEFKDKVMIIVGENGSGKTHILNMLYYIMSNQISELLNIEFEKIELTINDSKVDISKEDIESYYIDINENARGLDYLKTKLSKDNFIKIVNFLTSCKSKDEISIEKLNNMIKTNITITRLYKPIQDAWEELQKSKNIENLIKSIFINKTIYLPTYRRIEKGLEYIIKNDELIKEFEINDSEALINFGMQDTVSIINELRDGIKNLFLEAYSKMGGDMLQELLNSNAKVIDGKIDSETLNIILDRLGNKIDMDSKQSILNQLENGEIYNNKPILSLIKKLIDIYEGTTKEQESLIENFVNTCNKYLVKKRFIYDKNLVKVYILNERNNREILIENLSSGEKQIVSLFAKIYLKSEEFGIFFDEPELSLSIEWQKMLIVDILKSKNCKFMFVATHSPFIFDNELIEYTIDIDECSVNYGNVNE